MDDLTDIQYVGHFLPIDETMEQNQTENDATALYEHLLINKYNWKIKTVEGKRKGCDECIFLTEKPEKILYYNKMATTINLTKKIEKKQPQPTKLFVKYVPLSVEERNIQIYRENNLQPNGDNSESEDAEEEENEVTSLD